MLSGIAVCTVDDCAGVSVHHGYCGRHYNRWRRYGDPLAGGAYRGLPATTKVCAQTDSGGCGLEKPLSEFEDRSDGPGVRSRCADCRREQGRREYWEDVDESRVRGAERMRKHTASGRHLDAMLRREYGISHDDYDDMLIAQGGVCAITSKLETAANAKRLSVDHDHVTGNVRGLLTRKANSALGLLDDDPLLTWAATRYLLEHSNQGVQLNVLDRVIADAVALRRLVTDEPLRSVA